MLYMYLHMYLHMDIMDIMICIGLDFCISIHVYLARAKVRLNNLLGTR